MVYNEAKNRSRHQLQRRMNMLPEHAKQLLKKFFEVNMYSPSTRLIYVSALQSYTSAINGSIQKLCNQNLEGWYGRLKSMKYEPSTILLYAAKLRCLYVFVLMQDGFEEEEARQHAKKLFKNVPLKSLKRVAEQRNKLRDKLISSKEFKALLNASDHPRIKALLTTLYESNARPDEILRLRIRDVNFREKHALIRVCGKTGERTIPLIRSLPYLNAWLQVHPDRKNPDAPLWISSARGKLTRIYRTTINNILARLSNKVGLKRRIYPYMFRHTRLTELAEKGLSEFQMKSLAGWTTDSKMAARYVHLSGKTHLSALLEIEGMAEHSQNIGKESLIKTNICPRCEAQNTANSLYCYRCGLILEERLLYAELAIVDETDDMMSKLIEHPLVQKAIIEATKQLIAEGKVQLKTKELNGFAKLRR